ncbi:hypothetical protein LCGC14_0758830 [marine sediment metagenome]|uniref:Portal protein n=1 Tax=marine sediment metagenome TaxID=412755 RepID=A0A0F9T8Z0_9ZZZZ
MATTQSQFNLVRRQGNFNYPSPFFDIASTYVPPSVKELFKWCRFFFYSHSIISPIIFKISEYPITGLIYQSYSGTSLDQSTKEKWKTLLESTLKIKSRQIESLLDYNTYGNAFLSIMYPFKRYLVCESCDSRTAIEKTSYKWKDLKFFGECPKCNQAVEYKVNDVEVKNRSKCRLIRWNPFNINIDHCGPTDERVYVYKIPNKDKKSIIAGKKFWIERAPYIFLEAARKNQDIELDPENLFHFKRPGIADNDMGWGMPIILPVLKDAYWLQILRKANEAISLEHIVPWRIIFPSANADTSPYVNLNLGSWKNEIEKEVSRWRQDPNHISVMPLPIGTNTFGGDGKLLLVWQEEKILQGQIAGGLGVPLELIFGGLSWSGSSVSLRILENHFLTDRELLDEFLNEFLLPRLQRYFRLPKIKVKMIDFRMADDVQQKQLAMQLNQLGKLSDTTLLGQSGFDFEDELLLRKTEQIELIELQRKTLIQQAELSGMTQVVGAKYQAVANLEVARANNIAQVEGMQQQMAAQNQMMAQQGGQPVQGGGQGASKGSPQGKAQQGNEKAQGGGQQIAMAKGGLVTGGGGGEGGAAQVNTIEMVRTWAQGLGSLPEDQREMAISMYAKSHPETAALVRQFLKEQQKQTVDMRPNPEQKPPRRTSKTV